MNLHPNLSRHLEVVLHRSRDDAGFASGSTAAIRLYGPGTLAKITD